MSSSQSERPNDDYTNVHSFYFLTSNQRLYNDDITHSMTLSMTHFRDAAWVTISVTVLSVTRRRCCFSVTLFHDAA